MTIATENHPVSPTIPPSAPVHVVPYEQKLAASISYVLDEGGRLFMGASEVNKTMQRITSKLSELNIEYAVAGGMAMIAHGYVRFTDDVDILVKREDLDRLHENVDGLGWVRPFSKSKNLRDASTGVKVEFLLTGDYPGDGKPKPVSFPPPSTVATEIQGIKYLNVSTLINLKLASFLTGGIDRTKDQGDVVELMKALGLSYELVDEINPYVRANYIELCEQLGSLQRPAVIVWPGPMNVVAGVDQSALRQVLCDYDPSLREMFDEGVTPVLTQSKTGPMVLLKTLDRKVARKYQMVDEAEVLD